MKHVERIFADEGPLAAALPGYRRRTSQVDMARAVMRAIEDGGVLLAEAGTGTGKTLAYLMPAILSGQKVVISTGTRNLQEQIFFKDLRLIERALDRPIEAACLKGQDNYLCLRRFADFRSSLHAISHRADKVAALIDWAGATSSGDRMELAAIADDDPLWREVCSTRETRLGPPCPWHGECHVTAARQAAAEARLVVVNHHLYFADRAVRRAGGSVLPDHEVLILDEAHMVEDVATEFFSTSVGSGRVERLLDETGRLSKRLPPADDHGRASRERNLAAARALSQTLFSGLASTAGRRAFDPAEAGIGDSEPRLRLDATLEAVESSLRLLEGHEPEIDQLARRFGELRRDLALVFDEPAAGHVHWLETRKRTVIAGISPIDVSETVREEIFFRVPTVVLTSATLSAGGDFGYVKSRLGIDFDAAEISHPSPFDFRSRVRLYLPSHAGDPRHEDFAAEAACEVERLVRHFDGGALVLCTSYRNMTAFHSLLEGKHDGPLLLQGDAPKSLLLERFRDSGRAVLVATASFWQGIDVPGQALRLVIIDKLPFASPAEPIVAARIEHLRSSGSDPFREYQLPQAALTLKQGFGRLIRTDDDLGLVAVLDRRLGSASYRRVLLGSLPPCPILDQFSQVAAWWDRSRPPPARGTCG